MTQMTEISILCAVETMILLNTVAEVVSNCVCEPETRASRSLLVLYW